MAATGKRFLVVVMVLALSALAARAGDYVLPADAGVVNVKAEFGAKGDGVTDDTDAIRKAIAKGIERTSRYASPAFVYFPKGTYLVSGPLESRVKDFGWGGGWLAGMLLLGESRDASVIKLADQAPGYGDPAKPKWLIGTGSESDKHTKQGEPTLSGGGNRAFRHAVINLTVDTGKGNPGAIGIDYVCNNRGTIEDVLIRSGDGAGYCGLGLERHWPGPALVKNVEIQGFDYGMRVMHYQYSMTFEHIRLVGQKKAGILNKQNALFFRDVRSRNSVPVFVGETDSGRVVLIDGVFEGGSPSAAAIATKGALLARNLRSSGYGKVVDDQSKADKDVPGGAGPVTVEQVVLGVTTARFADAPKGLLLPIEETPTFNSVNPKDWVSVEAHGAKPGDGQDDTEALQKAIDSGGPIVYLPNGGYTVTKTLVVRGPVRKIMGMQSSLAPPKGVKVEPVIRFEGGQAAPVILEHLRVSGAIEHASAGTLAIRHIDFDGYYNTPQGTGKMFMEDTIGKPIRVLHPQKFWGRQVNCEFGEKPLIENHGGQMWLLGFKTEGEMTCLKTVKGRTEVLGALLYPLKMPGKTTPAFENIDGEHALTFFMNGGKNNYVVYVRETRGDKTVDAVVKELTYRGPSLYYGGTQAGQ